jgi:hypothetical protein
LARTVLLLVVFLSIIGAMLFAMLPGTEASHGPQNPSWVTVMAPFNGTWNRNNWAPPQTHPPVDPPDWSTDYYATAGTSGNWYSQQSGGSWSTAIIQRTHACNAGAYTWAGYRYKLTLTDPSGYLGYWQYVHVHPVGSLGNIVWGDGSSISQGGLLGYTHQYPNRGINCWDVSTDLGVHWHIEGWNNHNWSCFYPWAHSSNLTKQTSGLGAVGANAPKLRQPCW